MRDRTSNVVGTSDAATSSSKASGKSLFGEHVGEDAMREPAQVGEGVPNPILRRRKLRGGRGIDAGEGDLQMERDADQPLLRAVVQVAFDAPPLSVGGGNHASLGCLNVREPCFRRRRELRVLQRQPGSGCDRREHVALFGAPGDQETKHRARLVRQDDVAVVARPISCLAASGVDPSRLARDGEVNPLDATERLYRSGQPGCQPVDGGTGPQRSGRDHAHRDGDDRDGHRQEDQQQTGSCAVSPGRQPDDRRHDLHAQRHQHGANDLARGSRIAVSRAR